MAKKTLLLANVPGYDKSPINKAKIDRWVDDHHDIVVDYLNQTRSYVCDGIKKAVDKFYKEHERMPDLGVLKDIISREKHQSKESDTESEEDSVQPVIPPEWTWWWQNVLCKAAGDIERIIVIKVDKLVCLKNTKVWFDMQNNGSYPNFGEFSQTFGVNAKLLGFYT